MTTRPSPENKLTIKLRIEPSCLGPNGIDHIETFCAVAAKMFATVAPELVNWELTPRYDKQLPEQECFIDERRLSDEQTSLFLRHVGWEWDELQDQLDSILAQLVERYFKTLP
ncbi:hypothetical protein [Aeromonas cavernicola]|uniref:Uncharacterized protein n=1 Tax=Aeromonas cavernicola TaxID=1006623 RepID=A0A2H9U7H1_9GAMM|nr:hypothetical protein [Aeromonas cavernicola]PJG59997.1 hypothetical protein CUC53_04375 [Aeromonas cavernicola]